MHGHRCARYAVAALLVTLAACSDSTTTPATSFTADLSNRKEIPDTVTTAATGTATCTISTANSTIACIVNFTGLSGPPTASHIHLANANANGGIRVNLCGAGTAPACPATSPITSGDQPATGATFAAVVAAMRTYGAYVNVHTTIHIGGEMRGQIFGVYP